MKRTIRIFGVIALLVYLLFQIQLFRNGYALKDAVLLLQTQDMEMAKVIQKQAEVLTLCTAKVVDLDSQINPPSDAEKAAEKSVQPAAPSLREQLNFSEEEKSKK